MKETKRYFWGSLAMAFFCLIVFLVDISNVSAGEKKVYSLGLIPQGPALSMFERWIPFVERLSQESGLKFDIKVYDHVAEFEQDIKVGIFDFVYLNSTQEAAAFNQQGYIPMVRSQKFFKGAMFVAKDSPIQSIEELKGQDIAFVSERSLCSVVLQHGLKTEESVGDFNIVYAGSSSNVYKNVLLGKASAGGTLDVSLNRETVDVTLNLRSIYETPPMAPHPLAAHPRISEEVRKKIINAVVEIEKDEIGKKLLKTVRMPPPLVLADYDRDYKWLEKYVMD